MPEGLADAYNLKKGNHALGADREGLMWSFTNRGSEAAAPVCKGTVAPPTAQAPLRAEETLVN